VCVGLLESRLRVQDSKSKDATRSSGPDEPNFRPADPVAAAAAAAAVAAAATAETAAAAVAAAPELLRFARLPRAPAVVAAVAAAAVGRPISLPLTASRQDSK
jgi:hypothetical protein